MYKQNMITKFFLGLNESFQVSQVMSSSESETEGDYIKNGNLFKKTFEAKKTGDKADFKKTEKGNKNSNEENSKTILDILVKYPLSHLLLTQSLIFSRVGFSSSESINSFNKTKVASSAMLNCQMNGTHKIRMFW